MFSSKAVMVKIAYLYDVDTISILLLRMVFSLPFYIIIVLLSKPKKDSATVPRDYLYLLLFGFLGYYMASFFDFLGLNYIKAGLERIILFLYPTLVILISWLAFKERITRQQVLGITITYFGVLLIFFTEINLTEQDSVILGGFLIFLSALTYASYIVGSGWLIPKFGATIFTSYAMIVSSICVIIHYLFTAETSIFSLPVEVYWICLAMAIFATVIPSYLISFAIKGLGANNFSVLGSLGPVSTIVLAYFFLDEILSEIQIIGAIVVIGGVYVAEKKISLKKSVK